MLEFLTAKLKDALKFVNINLVYELRIRAGKPAVINYRGKYVFLGSRGIADKAEKPLILYNVPSRTGVNIEPSTYAALADHPNIAGIKEAGGNFSKIAETVSLVGDRLALYSGNDDQTVPMMALGASGVISVLSNVLPAETENMCRLFFEGKGKESAAMQCGFIPLISALFSDVNPIPVKEAMAMLGYCTPELRLPLVRLDEAKREILRTRLREAGLVPVM